jgi:hypothetical protein
MAAEESPARLERARMVVFMVVSGAALLCED